MSQISSDLHQVLPEYKDTKQYIRKIAIRTFFQFLASEVVGFGFGVPLATLLAILYGNIADIFIEIYLMPIVVITIVVVLFVAYPTNLYLSRGLIKTIFNPTTENAQKFSLISGRVSLYASINLFIRISVGGLIADLWGVIRQQGFILDRFITLGISPVMGALIASIVFYFISQGIFSKFNIEVARLSHTDGGEVRTVFRTLLPISDVFSIMISSVVLITSLIISIGYLFKATLYGILVITGLGAIMVGVLLYFYVSYTKQTIDNLKKAIRLFGEKGGKVQLSLIYDIEEAALVMKEYIDNLNLEHGVLLEVAKGLLDKPNKIDIYNSVLQTKLRSVIHLVKKFKILGIDPIEIRKLVFVVLGIMKALLDKLIGVESDIAFLLQQVKVLRGENESHFDGLGMLGHRISYVLDVLSSSVDVIKQIKVEIDRLKSVALSVIPKVQEFFKIGNDVEITFINFQLEMSRINYPQEFKVISDRLNKELREISKLVGWVSDEVSKINNENEFIVSSLNDISVGIDYALSLFESITGYSDDVGMGVVVRDIGEAEILLDKVMLKVQELRGRLSVLHKVLYDVIQVIDHFSDTVRSFNNNVSSIVSELEKVYSIADENSKILQEAQKNISSLFKKYKDRTN